MTAADARLYVKVDAAKCCGYTLCVQKCPDVYELDDKGFAYTTSDRVPLGLESLAQEGANLCPEGAIYVGVEPPDSP